MDREATYAFGIELRLTPSADGGRLTPLLGGSGSDRRFHYRPNWGLPGMIPPEQTGAPVLAFSREQIAAGEACRAVTVAMFPSQVPLWAEVTDDRTHCLLGREVGKTGQDARPAAGRGDPAAHLLSARAVALEVPVQARNASAPSGATE